MIRASAAWFALGSAMAFAIAGCGSLRQGESTSRCPDCAAALSRDDGKGGSIYSIKAAGDAAAARVARRYCAERGLGEPAVGARGPSSLGSDFGAYEFVCGPAGSGSASSATIKAAPAPAAPAAVAQGAATAPPTPATAAPVPDAVLSPQQQREQAVRALRLGLDALPARTTAQCAAPVTMWVRLPCGDVVSCTRTDEQVHCD